MHHDGQKSPVSAAVKGKKVQCIGRTAEYTLAKPVLRFCGIGYLVGFLLAAEKGFDILNALGVGRGDHLGHFDDPVPLHLAEHILIVDPLEVIRKPFVPAGKQPEERRLTCALSAYETEHRFEFASGIEHTADCAHQKQLHDLMGIVADICAQEVMQRIGDALDAVPLKAVQVIPNGMILILMSSDRQRLADAFFMV